MWRWLKRLFTRKKPTYRSSSSSSDSGASIKGEFFHPLALFKEDLAKLRARYSFKFDKDHFFILHYTSGRLERKARDFFKRFLDMGLCTYFIDGQGVIWQQHDGSKCGAHTGVTRWNGKSISKKSTGVEVACAGKVKKISEDVYESWFKQKFSKAEVREITKAQVTSGDYACAGFFVPYTPKQEESIAELMAWHVAKGLPKENLLGHDIVAYKRGRKADPSGSLSLPLKQFIDERVMPLVPKYQES